MLKRIPLTHLAPFAYLLLIGASIMGCSRLVHRRLDPSKPGTTVTEPVTAGSVFADLGKCFAGATTSDPKLVQWLGSLFAKPDGATIVGSLLTGPGAQLFACGAAELATLERADIAGTLTKGQAIETRANECLAGPCERAELRAARLLRQLAGEGKLRLPPSGQG